MDIATTKNMANRPVGVRDRDAYAEEPCNPKGLRTVLKGDERRRLRPSTQHWEEELDTLLLQTRDACGDDAYCIGEVYWLWAKAHAFYHRQRRIEEQSPVA
jgi:hypothetical protein